MQDREKKLKSPASSGILLSEVANILKDGVDHSQVYWDVLTVQRREEECITPKANDLAILTVLTSDRGTICQIMR